jgi:hypothetical protein
VNPFMELPGDVEVEIAELALPGMDRARAEELAAALQAALAATLARYPGQSLGDGARHQHLPLVRADLEASPAAGWPAPAGAVDAGHVGATLAATIHSVIGGGGGGGGANQGGGAGGAGGEP